MQRELREVMLAKAAARQQRRKLEGVMRYLAAQLCSLYGVVNPFSDATDPSWRRTIEDLCLQLDNSPAGVLLDMPEANADPCQLRVPKRLNIATRSGSKPGVIVPCARDDN